MADAAAGLAFSAGASERRVAALLAAHGLDPASVCLDVAAGDEMLSHGLAYRDGDRELALVDYFRAGLAAERVAGEVLERVFSEEERAAGLSVLDFASGWGRMTRFLVRRVPPERLTVADVSAPAVAFQRERFGVSGFVSAAEPEGLEPPAGAGPFDAVLVHSLFTHLPRGSFGRWLARLWELVAPGGLLAFSTHDLATAPGWAGEPAADGFLFTGWSEIPELGASYGNAWAAEGFVRARLGELDGVEADDRRSVVRLPRALWHLQDLWLAAKPPRRLDGLWEAGGGLAFRGLPAGEVDAARRVGERRLELAGWAGSLLHPGGPVEVAVSLDGRPAGRFEAGGERPDVAAAHDRPALAASGWSGAVEAAPAEAALAPEALVLVEARDLSGARHVLHLASVEGLLAHLERRRLAARLARAEAELAAADGHVRALGAEVAELRRRVAAMEASRFWKLGRAWRRVTGRGG